MVRITAADGETAELTLRAAMLSGLFAAMIHEVGDAEEIPMPWSGSQLAQVTAVITALADAVKPSLADLLPAQMYLQQPARHSHIKYAHRLLQLLDFADVRVGVDLLHNFILRALTSARTPEKVLALWLSPDILANLSPAEQFHAYEQCLAHVSFIPS